MNTNQIFEMRRKLVKIINSTDDEQLITFLYYRMRSLLTR